MERNWSCPFIEKSIRTNSTLRGPKITMKGTKRLLAAVFLIFLGAIPAHGQLNIQIHPEDITWKAGVPFTLRMDVDVGGGFSSLQAYVGEHPDNSMPIDGLRAGSGTDALFTTSVPETTQFWFKICNTFGCADTRTTTVTIPVAEPEFPPALEGAEDLGGNWFRSSWFGDFNIEFDPWLFHAQHGWMFLFADSTPESVFLFDLASGAWFFTNATTYPNLFSFGRSSWVFYFEGTSGPRDFVDLVSGDFFSLE